jgi:hypothetical protein
MEVLLIVLVDVLSRAQDLADRVAQTAPSWAHPVWVTALLIAAAATLTLLWRDRGASTALTCAAIAAICASVGAVSAPAGPDAALMLAPAGLVAAAAGAGLSIWTRLSCWPVRWSLAAGAWLLAGVPIWAPMLCVLLARRLPSVLTGLNIAVPWIAGKVRRGTV